MRYKDTGVFDRSFTEPFAMKRLRVVMEPNRSDPFECEGVLNPGAVRGPDGNLYLFPRLVGKGNYSRIGIARVRFNDDGDPVGVERLGVALEPTEPYEKNPISGGGCEDPRVVYCEPFRCYVMTYTAFSPRGARIAMAISQDLFHWERIGLARFAVTGLPDHPDFNQFDNKDALLFPTVIPDHRGVPSVGLIHRPLVPASAAPPDVSAPSGDNTETPSSETSEVRQHRLRHESLWLSYCHEPTDPRHLSDLHAHHRLMSPRASWERIKVGGGAPPLLTRHGWLVLYHGVSGHVDATSKHRLRYSAGALILNPRAPEEILYRSPHPILAPEPEDAEGVVPNVVFPTGIDRRDDLGAPDRIDVYYGVADDRIGVASFEIPVSLPQTKEPPEARRDAA